MTTKAQMGVCLPRWLMDQSTQRAKADGTSRSDLVCRALTAHLAHEKPQREEMTEYVLATRRALFRLITERARLPQYCRVIEKEIRDTFGNPAPIIRNVMEGKYTALVGSSWMLDIIVKTSVSSRLVRPLLRYDLKNEDTLFYNRVLGTYLSLLDKERNNLVGKPALDKANQILEEIRKLL